MKAIQTAAVALVFLLAACNEEQPAVPVDPVLRIAIGHTFDGQPLTINNIQYETPANTIGFSTISYYLSGFEFKKSDGNWFAVPDRVELIRGELNLKDTLVFKDLPKGAYTGVRFTLGVDSMNNHADPALWPNEHPLSLMKGGQMHWSWNAGYIFLKLEGRYKRNDGRIDGLFSYHIGRDDLATKFTFENVDFNFNDEVIDLGLNFRADRFFATPHVHTISDSSGFTHSSFGDEVADILHGNMFDIFTLE
jgi:hypothetical protein